MAKKATLMYTWFLAENNFTIRIVVLYVDITRIVGICLPIVFAALLILIYVLCKCFVN